MLLVDFDAPSNLRALARFDAEARARGRSRARISWARAIWRFTIDPGGEMTRYQGVIALDGQGFESAAHHYFERSEQIPTLVRLAVGETVTAERRGLARRRPHRRSSCPKRARAGAAPTSIPATRRRASSRTGSRTTTPGPKPRRARRRPKTTSSSIRRCRASACSIACSTSAACGSSSRRRWRRSAAARRRASTRCCAAFTRERVKRHDRRRRHDRRHLRILLDQARLQPRRLRRLTRTARRMDESEFAAEARRDRGRDRARPRSPAGDRARAGRVDASATAHRGDALRRARGRQETEAVPGHRDRARARARRHGAEARGRGDRMRARLFAGP